ncbi:MAG: hypothetical protein ACXWW0_02240 [Bacteroidia bacterium]
MGKFESYELLNDYFTAVSDYNVNSIEDSVLIFEKYIKPIGVFYESGAGFAIFIPKWMLFILTFFLFLFFYFIQDKTILIFILVPYIIFIYWLGRKYVKNRLYGFLF